MPMHVRRYTAPILVAVLLAVIIAVAMFGRSPREPSGSRKRVALYASALKTLVEVKERPTNWYYISVGKEFPKQYSGVAPGSLVVQMQRRNYFVVEPKQYQVKWFHTYFEGSTWACQEPMCRDVSGVLEGPLWW